MKNILLLENVLKKYSYQTVLHSVSFSVKPGEVVLIVGPNGGGKSTLIKAILNLEKIDSGKITLNTTSIGYLAQSSAMHSFFPATVEEIILANKNARFKNEYYDKIIKLLDLNKLLKKRIGAVSGGEKQRVLLARALIDKPKLLILDEPITALDSANRNTLYSLINKISEEINTTILLISHDVGSAAEYINRIVYLDKTVLFDGDMNSFCERPDLSPYVHNHPLRSKDGNI